MENSIFSQGLVFLSLMLCGAVVSAAFDVFRTFRKVKKKTGGIALAVQDIIFWIVAATIIFISLLKTNSGELRFYEVLALAGGAIIYLRIFSRLFRKIIFAAFMVLKNSICFFLKMIAAPFAFICKFMSRPVIFAVSISRKGFRRTGRRIKRTGAGIIKQVKFFRKVTKKT